MIAIAVDELRQLRRREIIVESPAGFAVNPRYCDGAMLTEKCCGYSHVQDATELVDFFNQEHYRKFMVFFNLQMNPDSIKRNL